MKYLYYLLTRNHFQGGLYIPGDGLVNAKKLTDVLASKAEEQGLCEKQNKK